MSQPGCHISSSRSCPAPSWAPPLQDSSSCSARPQAQLSVDSGGSLSLSLHSRPVPPPAYSESSQHRGGLSAPSFTTLNNSLTSHPNNHSGHS